MAITVVEEGEQVVFNCTPTVNRTVTFTAPPPNMDMFSPVNNVLSFPADLSFGGLYACRVDNAISQNTTLAVLPGNLSPHLSLTYTCVHVQYSQHTQLQRVGTYFSWIPQEITSFLLTTITLF